MTISSSLLTDASGYSFKEWKGALYSQKIRPEDMLAHCVGLLRAVEINSSIYAMPRTSMLATWASGAPARFCFSIKAPRLFRRQAWLRTDADALSPSYAKLDALGHKRSVASAYAQTLMNLAGDKQRSNPVPFPPAPAGDDRPR